MYQSKAPVTVIVFLLVTTRLPLVRAAERLEPSPKSLQKLVELAKERVALYERRAKAIGDLGESERAAAEVHVRRAKSAVVLKSADVKAASAEVALRTTELDRLRQLFRKNVGGKEEVEKAQAVLQAVQSRLAVADAQTKEARNVLEQREAELRRIEAEAVVRQIEAEIDTSNAKAEVIRLAVKLEQSGESATTQADMKPLVKNRVGLTELTWLEGNWGSNGDRAVATRASGGHYISNLTIVRDEDDRLVITYIYTTRRSNAAVRHDAFRHSATWDEKQRQFHVETRRIDAVRDDDDQLTFDSEELQSQPARQHILALRKEAGGDDRWIWSIWIKRPGRIEFSRFHELPAVRGERDEDLRWDGLLLDFPRPARIARWPYDTITPNTGFGPVRMGRPLRSVVIPIDKDDIRKAKDEPQP